MLSDERIKRIQRFRCSSDFTVEYIRDFDKRWNERVEKLINSGADLKRIRIAKDCDAWGEEYD